MIVLDTNVVSELIRDVPATAVVRWARSVPSAERFLTAVSVGELVYGVSRLPEGRRRTALEAAVASALASFSPEQFLPFDEAAARPYGSLFAHRERLGRPIEIADAQIAAICLHHGAALATRNPRDFTDLDLRLINPWTA
ncbi:type II toxin-antitoxin system VapC family toxin [Geodermatophilus sp. DF01-2]|uniref:type II toxin-antitoxin system VapC family toxin n=1 Tax=Geodermatophilus sp. DF01-2 TaxID=2559610 RepID=UPI001073568A|nr:type II toxin-antitoxin system VapC family toxin [Geodermatophilus sp. DF01_2]TFV55770.1 type II toxin-antitoxin system VapC family toxin [Geodermatophilus sp. DF01_2]